MNVFSQWFSSLRVGKDYNTMHYYEGTGSDSFDINFTGGYIDKSHVKALVDEGGQPVTVTFVTTSRVRLSRVVPVGSTVLIYRDTPKVLPLAMYTDGALLNASNMDRNAKQAVFVAAEMLDRFDTFGSSLETSVEQVSGALRIANNALLVASSVDAKATQALSDAAAAILLARNASDVANSATSAVSLLAQTVEELTSTVDTHTKDISDVKSNHSSLVTRVDDIESPTGSSNVGHKGVQGNTGVESDTVGQALDSVNNFRYAICGEGMYVSPDIGSRLGKLAYALGSNGGAKVLTDVNKYVANGWDRSANKPRSWAKVYYVTKDGSDSAEGGKDTPLRTLSVALAKPDRDVVIVEPGRWTVQDAFSEIDMSRDLALVCLGGEALITPQRECTWSLVSGTVYKSTALGGTPIRMFDMSIKDAFGCPVWFKRIEPSPTAEAEVEDTPYSFTKLGSGATQFVKANFGGILPGNNDATFVLRSVTVGANYNGGGSRLYMQGLTLMGGDSSGFTPRDGNISSVCFADRCKFMNSHMNDAYRALGVGISICVDSQAYNGAKDGFNYHGWTNSAGEFVNTHFLELNCIGANNVTTTGTANGSTAHDACIGFRIGGMYGYGTGPGIADIGSTKSYNAGCSSVGGFGDQNSKGYIAADDCEMWLHACTGRDNRTADLCPQGRAKVHLKGSLFTSVRVFGESTVDEF